MKKSRIIVPALAMLTLSVAASVTGTVAWFTASRTASMSASSVAAVNTAGNLSYTLIAGVGTQVSSNSVTLSPMMDASVNATANFTDATPITNGDNIDVFTANFNSESHITGLTARKGTYFKDINSTKIYTLNSWQIKFTSNAVEDNYLYFDGRRTKSNIANPLEGQTFNVESEKVYKALRVYMASPTKKIIWAPYTGETEIYTAVQGGSIEEAIDPSVSFSGVSSQYGSLISKVENTDNVHVILNEKETVISDGSSFNSASSDASLLGTTLKSGTPLTVSCMIWFEGLDSSCVVQENSGISSVTALVNRVLNLSFYAVDSTTLTGARA